MEEEISERIWFQYVVGYDKQEQRSLATSLQNRLSSLRTSLVSLASTFGHVLSSKPGPIARIGLGMVLLLVLLFLAKRIKRYGWRAGLRVHPDKTVAPTSTVQFYERMTRLLSSRGVERESHLTPLEFAGGVEFQPALAITRAYNRVRFGRQPLSAAELREIEEVLEKFEGEREE